MSVNKVILVGRLGNAVECRYSASGKAISNFGLATSEHWKTKDGEKKEKTEWHRVVCFDKLAEICRDNLGKGRQVYVEGRIQTRQWDDRDGNKRYTTEVVAQTVRFLGNKPTSQDVPQDAPQDDPQVPSVSTTSDGPSVQIDDTF